MAAAAPWPGLVTTAAASEREGGGGCVRVGGRRITTHCARHITTRNLLIHDGFLMTFLETLIDDLVKPHKPGESPLKPV